MLFRAEICRNELNLQETKHVQQRYNYYNYIYMYFTDEKINTFGIVNISNTVLARKSEKSHLARGKNKAYSLWS